MANKIKMKEEKIYFKNKHGEKLCGILTVPADTSKKHSLVILCNGFSSSKESRTYLFLSKQLFKYQILSLRFDFYGHGESDGRFEDITITEGYEDILSAIDYVRNLGYVNKIALFGTSFGGVCSVLAASKSKNLAALGLKAPALEMAKSRKMRLGLEGIEEWKEKGFVEHQNHEGRKFRLNYSFYEDASGIDAYEAAKNIHIPTLMVHGDKDDNVPIIQSEKLTKSIKNSVLEEIKGANHFFDKKEHYDQANELFLKFFKEVLA